MGTSITFKRPDGKETAGYLANAARGNAPGVVVVQEWWGLSENIKGLCDRFAVAGFDALAPDLYKGRVTQKPDEANHLMTGLDFVGASDQDIAGAVKHLAGTSRKVGVMGFCLGGKFAYLASTRLPIEAAVSYYGVEIDQYLGEADRRKCPILMHFAENDPHVPASTVAAIQARMGGSKGVDIHIYPGTEHGFNRQGYPPYNETAAAQARQRTLAHLHHLLS